MQFRRRSFISSLFASCLGKAIAMNEMRVILAMTVHHFIIKKDPTFTIQLEPTLLLHPVTGVRVLFERILQ